MSIVSALFCVLFNGSENKSTSIYLKIMLYVPRYCRCAIGVVEYLKSDMKRPQRRINGYGELSTNRCAHADCLRACPVVQKEVLKITSSTICL